MIKYSGYLYKSLIIILFIIIYPLIIPSPYDVIDPCSGTPGYTHHPFGWILFFTYPFFIAGLIYLLFAKRKIFIFENYVKLIITVIVWMLFSFIIAIICWGYLENNMIDFITDMGYFTYFFEYGCYNDIEAKGWTLSMLYALNTTLWGWLIFFKMGFVKRLLEA